MNAVGWCLRDAVYAGHHGHGHVDFIVGGGRGR